MTPNNEVKQISTQYTTEPICPHCGHRVRDSWELDEDGTYDCGECGEEFNYTKNITITYSTSKS